MLTLAELDLLKDTDTFAVMDLETTGFHYGGGDRITDICIYTIENGKYTSKFESLVNTDGRKIPREVQELTGITDTMVKWAPSIDTLLPTIYEYLKGKVLVVHNKSFDYTRFLVPIFKDRMRIDLELDVIDTLKLAKNLENFKTNKLGAVYERLMGDTLEVTHRAEPDVIMTSSVLMVYQKYVREHYELLKMTCSK